MAGPSGKLEPGRRKEAYKAFLRLKSYLIFKLNSTMFSGSEIKFKREIRENMNDIEEDLTSKKLLSKLDNEVKIQAQKKKQMEEIINPKNDEQNTDAVKTWFESSQARDLEKELQDIYRIAKQNKSITKRKYDKFCNGVLLELILSDKSRPSSYTFR